MRTISTNTVYTCPIFKVEERVVEHENGHVENYWYVIKLPNVSVIGLTNDKNIVFISENRGNGAQLEIPGGKTDSYDPDDEDLRDQALAELAQETGYKATDLEYLSKAVQNTDWSERVFHYFLAWNLEAGAQNLEAGEQITIVLMSLEEVRDKLSHGQFPAYLQQVLSSALTKFSEKGLI